MLSDHSYRYIWSFKKNSSRVSIMQLSVSYILRDNSLKHSVLLPFCRGGVRGEKCWQKGGQLALFEFLVEEWVKKGEWIFSGEPEDFLKIIFSWWSNVNCWSNVNYGNNHKSRDLSKQVWCLLDGTESSIF